MWMVDSRHTRLRTVTGIALAWLLVLGLAACGGDDGWLSETDSADRDNRVTVMAAAPPTTATAAAASATTAARYRSEDRGEAYQETTITPAPTATVGYGAGMQEESMAMGSAAEWEAPYPEDTTFHYSRRSRFVPTSEDRVSTFSLDADRTSFQLALNWAHSGYDVDPDSVRAEEWINAFDYGYDYPAHTDSFAIITDVVRHPLDDRKHLARIGFQAPEFRDERPLNVTLVLDASGSMEEENRVAIAREAAESIRRGLRERDRIAVVHFSEDVLDDLTVRHRHPDEWEVEDSINRLAPHNSTNVQAGLDLGVRLADRIRRQRPDAYNYIILMSDGVANVDATDPFAILESTYDADSSNPLRLITIGVGISNYNDYLLEQLAQYGNGWYRYLSDIDQARTTFSRDNWLALSVPFADQTRAQITWNDQVVESWRMIGYENRVTSDESFVEDRREFAEIPVGAATTVFYELELSDRAWRDQARPVELADVALRWVTPIGGLSNRQTTAIRSRTDADLRSADALLQLGAVVALSSDRYSSLPYGEAASWDVAVDLSVLSSRLRTLELQLGSLDSYSDFSFVLDHLMRSVPGEAQGRSGYGR